MNQMHDDIEKINDILKEEIAGERRTSTRESLLISQSIILAMDKLSDSFMAFVSTTENHLIQCEHRHNTTDISLQKQSKFEAYVSGVMKVLTGIVIVAQVMIGWGGVELYNVITLNNTYKNETLVRLSIIENSLREIHNQNTVVTQPKMFESKDKP